jgi:hypothetical protein
MILIEIWLLKLYESAFEEKEYIGLKSEGVYLLKRKEQIQICPFNFLDR